jgi:hypothetical protein
LLAIGSKGEITGMHALAPYFTFLPFYLSVNSSGQIQADIKKQYQ